MTDEDKRLYELTIAVLIKFLDNGGGQSSIYGAADYVAAEIGLPEKYAEDAADFALVTHIMRKDENPDDVREFGDSLVERIRRATEGIEFNFDLEVGEPKEIPRAPA